MSKPEIRNARAQNTIISQLAGHEAELKQVIESHQQLIKNFQANTAAHQQRANFLEGAIATLKGLLPSPPQTSDVTSQTSEKT